MERLRDSILTPAGVQNGSNGLIFENSHGPCAQDRVTSGKGQRASENAWEGERE